MDLITDQDIVNNTIYYNKKIDHGKWKRLLKYPLDKNLIYSKFANNIRLNILENSMLSVTDGELTEDLSNVDVTKLEVIFDLLRGTDCINRYKLSLYVFNKQYLYVRVYINMNFLNDICSKYYTAPRIICNLFLNSNTGTYGSFNYITDKITPYRNIEIHDKLCPYIGRVKLIPKEYQKNNVVWMNTVERNVDFGLHNFQYAKCSDLLKFETNSMSLFMDKKSHVLYDNDSIWRYKSRFRELKLKGGVLCDQVGLGKTFSMACLILANPSRGRFKYKHSNKRKTIAIKKKSAAPVAPASASPKNDVSTTNSKKITVKFKLKSNSSVISTPTENSKSVISAPVVSTTFNTQGIVQANEIPEGFKASTATIVYCPRRLVGQWESEMIKYLGDDMSDFTVLTLSTMNDINRYSIFDLQFVDMVIVSTSLLSNKIYLNQDKIDLTKLYWHRVIVDEGHEVLVHDVKRVADVRTNRGILNTHGRYKWCCTGTPLPDGRRSMDGILSFLLDYDIGKKTDVLEHINVTQYQELIQKLFHRNTKESTKREVFIPRVIEQTELLEFTKTERAIYDKAYDPTRMMQLCTNILISDEDSAVLGGNAMSLDQINYAMGTHHRERVEYFKKLIIRNKETLQEIKEKRDVEVTAMEVEFEDLKNQCKKLGSSKNEEKLNDYKKEFTRTKTYYKNKVGSLEERIKFNESELKENKKQVALFTSLNTDVIKNTICPITGQKINNAAITNSGHIYSAEGLEMLFSGKRIIKCPFTRETLEKGDILLVSDVQNSSKDKSKLTADEIERNKWGTKMAYMVKTLKNIFSENADYQVIIFSQWSKMLTMISQVLDDHNINHVFCKGNVHMMTKSINKFKKDKNIKIILLSSEDCSSGSNLTEATHIFLMDTVNASKENAKAVEEQAIARAARLGQKYNVIVKRFIMKDTIEHEYYLRNYGENK